MSDYRDWQVGDRVVCVGGPKPGEPEPNPVVGEVYTISWIGLDSYDEVIINLAEMPAPWPQEPWDWGLYDPACFRKVQPRKTSIAIFTRFLKDADAPIHEEA